jgi:hypothetical protein
MRLKIHGSPSPRDKMLSQPVASNIGRKPWRSTPLAMTGMLTAFTWRRR